MTANTLVSVVLGTYNGEKYLKEQIDSILQQTYSNIELVVTDDCSTDNTPTILREFADRHENVRVYFNEKNLGFVRNFEKAVQQAQGKYIAFSDQDDIWLPEKIQRLVDNIGNNTLIYSDSAYMDADGRLTGKKLSDYRNWIIGKNLYAMDSDSIWVTGHAMMFRRELVGSALPFPTSPYISHDVWMAYIAMLKGTISFVPDALVLYRQHGRNTAGGLGCHKMMKKNKTVKTKDEQIRQATEKIEAFLSPVPNTEPEFRDFLNKLYLYTANPTFVNRVRRMQLRLKYINRIYAPRKRNLFRRIFKVIKTF
jgi:glycosyltransferase involved in cell wall biosynthesis